MIGNEALAQFISSIDWTQFHDEWNELHTAPIPEGWEYLMSGAYRHAFRGPDGFVYKVAIDRYSDQNSEQEYLYNEYIRGNEFDGFRFAEVDYFADCNVGVSEFIDGIHPEMEYGDQMALYNKIRAIVFHGEVFPDIHSHNIILSNGQLVIIDF